MREMFKKTYLFGYYTLLVILLILGIISLFHIDEIQNYIHEETNKHEWRWCNKYQEYFDGNFSMQCLNDCRDLFGCNITISGDFVNDDCLCNGIPLSSAPYKLWMMKKPDYDEVPITMLVNIS